MPSSDKAWGRVKRSIKLIILTIAVILSYSSLGSVVIIIIILAFTSSFERVRNFSSRLEHSYMISTHICESPKLGTAEGRLCLRAASDFCCKVKDWVEEVGMQFLFIRVCLQ